MRTRTRARSGKFKGTGGRRISALPGVEPYLRRTFALKERASALRLIDRPLRELRELAEEDRRSRVRALLNRKTDARRLLVRENKAGDHLTPREVAITRVLQTHKDGSVMTDR
jgi:hypothetical protein